MLERGLDIPLPISKENADEYFEVLAKKKAEKDAEKWIEKHSTEDNNYNLVSNSKEEISWVGKVVLFTLTLLIILFLLFIWFVMWLTENLTMSTM